MDTSDIEYVIDKHRALQERIYELAREDDGKRMGDDAWLDSAIGPSDLNLWYGGGDYINVNGYTWTSQTMGSEYFDFDIPVEDL
jgi:hypothetical protein